MVLNASQLVELAIHKPDHIAHEVDKLENHQRLELLEQITARGVSRRLAEALHRYKHDRDRLALGQGVTVFLAKTSFPALSSFQLHMFRDAHGAVWGRTVTSAPTLVGPGYFGVHSGDELVLDFDRVPPPEVALPGGWPPVVSNDSGLAAIALAGTSFHLHGSGRGVLTGSVWRNGREQGVFVNLVRA